MGNGNKKVGDSPLLFLFNVDLTQITYRFITEGVFLWEPAMHYKQLKFIRMTEIEEERTFKDYAD